MKIIIEINQGTTGAQIAVEAHGLKTATREENITAQLVIGAIAHNLVEAGVALPKITHIDN